MNLNDLIKCVECAKNIKVLSTKKADAMLNELQEITARYRENGEAEIWDYEVVVATINDYIDITNMQLYDYFGELYVANNHDRVSFEKFAEYVRTKMLRCVGFQQATDAMLQAGYNVITDLYYENEREGMHDENGHFKNC